MKLTGKEKVSYGLGAVGKDMVYMFSASYVLYYYQDILGVSAIAMGIILMAARVFDAFNDPIMGVVVAKTRTKWGKFRPWLFIGKRTGGICGSDLHFVGCYLYHDGYPILVDDPGFYGGRKRERRTFHTRALLRRSRFCDRDDHHNEMCLYVRAGK